MEGLTQEELEKGQRENKRNVITKVEKFIQDGCGCSRRLSGIQCSSQFMQETILNNLYNCLELTSAELDLVMCLQIFQLLRLLKKKKKKEKETHHLLSCISRGPYVRTCF